MAVFHQPGKPHIVTLDTQVEVLLHRHPTRLNSDQISRLNTAGQRIRRVNLDEIHRPTLLGVGAAFVVIEARLPQFVDTPVGYPQLITLGLHELVKIGPQFPG